MKNLIFIPLISALIQCPVNRLNTNDLVYSELNQDSNFHSQEYVFDKNIKKHREFEGILLHEHESKDLIFYVFNVTGFEMLDPNDCRILLSLNSDLYNHYSLDFLGRTSDYKFYKFKVNDFQVDYSVDIREYKIAEFETKQERVYIDDSAVGLKSTETYFSSTISQVYQYSSDGLVVDYINTLTIDVYSDYFRVPGSTTSIPFEGIAQNDIFYIYFLMPKNLGDLIKIDLEWYENYSHYSIENGISIDQKINYYDDCYKDKYFRKIITNEDKTILDENKDFFWNPLNWFVGGSLGVNLKNLQRFSINNLDKLINETNEYCLSNDTISKIKEWLSNPITLLNYDPYIIRYSVKEFYKKETQRQDSLGIISFQAEYKKYSMTDIDIITCTFAKEGKVYSLPVVSNTNNQYVNNEVVPNPEWLKKLFTFVGLILGILILIPLFPYLIQLILWIIKLPIKFLKRIITLFKSNKKKPSNYNKKKKKKKK